VVLEYNGQAVQGTEQLARLVRETPADRQVKIVVSRGGSSETLTATIGTRKDGMNITTGQGRMFTMPDIRIPEFTMPDIPNFQMNWQNPRLGIVGETLGREAQFADFLGVKEGVLVKSVAANSAAEKAGIKAGDVIVAVGGTTLDASHTLTEALGTNKPGDMVTLQITSPGQSQRAVTVTLGANPSNASSPYLGISYREVSPRTRFFRNGRGPEPGPFPRPNFPYTQTVATGAMVRSVSTSSPAASAGLQPGDIITSVDNTTITNAQALITAIGAHKPGDTVTLGVRRSNTTTGNTPATLNVQVKLAANPNNSGTAFLGVTLSDVFTRPPNFQRGQPGQQGIAPFGIPGTGGTGRGTGRGLNRFFGGNGGSGGQGGSQPQPAPLGSSL
jgi:S1-C subfamily serine protease